MAQLAASPPSLQEALIRSTRVWQDDLQSLFNHTKDWFPDVVWELQVDDDDDKPAEEVWGHKAVVYARAPPSFQARYFSFRPAPIASPSPYGSSPLPTQSAFSLSLGPDFPSRSPSPSPFRAPSPSPSTIPGAPLRIPTSINSALFSNELEYLYTGRGLGDAFEFLFDTSETRTEADGGAARVDKLRKDLVFMWRSRLYSDVRIALEGNFSSQNHETTMAIFSSHRFVLVARSPYFHKQLITWGVPPTTTGEPITVTLPSPPFTPASLHFTLGYIYTGTLVFSHRTYDLDTAFAILRSATYLELGSLHDEVQARIVQEMLHGLFHAFLDFAEYERVTGGKWGVGGCRCRQCARRVPRTLEFAIQPDVQNAHLERGARRALVGLFGEGWCNPEFAALPQKTRDGVLKGLAKRTTPENVFAILYAAHHALGRIDGVIDAWADVVRDMLLAARRTVDRVLCDQAEACFEQPDWLEIVEEDGARFDDAEHVGWIMDAVQRGLADKNGAMVYQILVSSILLRPHPTESGQTALSSTSDVRLQVEQARVEVLRWLRKRWLGVRQENAFEPLEDWALKEISHEIDVPVEDLLAQSSSAGKGAAQKTTLKVTNRDDGESASMHSMRSSAVSRSGTRPNGRESLHSSASSVRSAARSTHSTVSRASTTTTTARRKAVVPPGPRPDSKLTPSTSSLASSLRSSVVTAESSPSLARSNAARRPTLGLSVPDKPTRSAPRPPSVTSVRSHASTIRKSSAPTSATGLRPPSADERPESGVSSAASDGSTAFKSAKSELSAGSAARARRFSSTSTASTTSNVTSPSAKSPKVAKAAVPPTTPRLSGPTTASRTSLASSATSFTSSSVRSRRVTPSASESSSRTGTMSRSVSSASTRSTASARSSAASASPVVAKKATPPRKPVSPAVNPRTSKASLRTNGSARTSVAAPATPKGKGKAVAVPESRGEGISRASSETNSTVRETPMPKRKSSADTIREAPAAPPPTLQLSDVNGLPAPLGATLEIGIPCIISSKRARFRALARYIGEVAGERGPWVGVEVPVGDGWPAERLEGRQWHDGTWGGIRYFDLGAAVSDWDGADERRRATSRATSRAGSRAGNYGSKGLKREGEQLSMDRAKRFRSASPAVSDVSMAESRGLFVRPQQVLYVVDAVGDL